MENLIIIIATLVPVVIISIAYFFKFLHDKNAVIKDIQRKGGKLVELKSRTGLVKREWKVKYIDKDGNQKEKVCLVQPGWGSSVYWN